MLGDLRCLSSLQDVRVFFNFKSGFQKDTTQILWALGPPGSDGELPKHVKSGSRPLRLLQPVAKPESIPLKQWDVRLTNVSTNNISYALPSAWYKLARMGQ